MNRIVRNAQPSRLTIADRNRQRIALAAYDKRQRNARAWHRIAWLAYLAASIAVGVALFYSLTDGAN